MSQICEDRKKVEDLTKWAANHNVDGDTLITLAGQAKEQIEQQTTETLKRQRQEQWSFQLDRLCRSGYPDAAGMLEEHFLREIEPLEKHFLQTEGVHDQGRIPAVIVIPPSFVSPVKKMTLVQLGDKFGFSSLSPGKFYNTEGVKTLNVPYLMTAVEDGRVMCSKSPDDCMKYFADQGRFGCTADESISIITFWPEILQHHSIDCPGSLCGSPRQVLSLYLGDARPELDWGSAGISNSHWGSASCGSRLGP